MYPLPPSWAGRPRQTVHPEFLKMLSCDFLLEFFFRSVDFEPFLTKTGQVPIFGFLSAKSLVLIGPSTKSPALSVPKAKVTYPLPPSWAGRPRQTAHPEVGGRHTMAAPSGDDIPVQLAALLGKEVVRIRKTDETPPRCL